MWAGAGCPSGNAAPLRAHRRATVPKPAQAALKWVGPALKCAQWIERKGLQPIMVHHAIPAQMHF